MTPMADTLCPDLSRRLFLTGGGALAASLALPATLYAARAPTEQRLVFIIQRGAMDGLHAVPPVGDPSYATLRGALAQSDSPRKLDAMFGLHSSLSEVGKIYDQRQALLLHAIASPYRDRSHFDGQDVLETAGVRPYQTRDGWLNRISLLIGGEALALAPTIPVALRGKAPTPSYAPSGLPTPDEDLMVRIDGLYRNDPVLHAAWEAAKETRAIGGGKDAGGRRQNPVELGQTAARFLNAPDGARIAMIETSGWDSHANQAGLLKRSLSSLDLLIGSLKAGLGAQWARTLVVVATEFGRTAAVNGTNGTDHGTASVAMLLGGGVTGGRVVADWPGLRANQLFEDRDLAPTADIRAAIGGAAAAHFGVDPPQLMAAMLPDQERIVAMEGLVRA